MRTVERIKAARPDATIGADLIAGFPTETEEMALNSLKLLDDCDIVAAHVFPFSPRPDTPAARMPQLAPRSREGARRTSPRSRGRAPMRAGSTAWSAPRSRCSSKSDGKGHTDNFAPVAIAGAARGERGTARITGRDGDHLTAVWA